MAQVAPEFCRCADGENATLVAKIGKCLIVCEELIEPKHRLCPPCAHGNHTGQPCAQYVPKPIAHLDRKCAACGFDSALHGRGSDGSLN